MDPIEWDWSRPVFDHVHLRVRDLQAAKAFYVTVLEPLGLPLLIDIPQLVGFPNFALSDDGPPTENAHVAFRAASREEVGAFHDPDGTNVEAVHREAG